MAELIECIYPSWPLKDRVGALVSTRLGGVSAYPYNELNLGDHVGDDTLSVMKNRRLLAEHADLDENNICWLKQVHGEEVVESRSDNMNAQADALWSDAPGQVCAIMTADCLPVLFSDESGHKVAAAHAGWRGLAKNILNNVLQLFPEKSKVYAFLGPAIGPKHFEVGNDVLNAFTALNPESQSLFMPGRQDEKYLLDIYQFARLQLQKLGVKHIYGGDYCTFAQPEMFYSFRRDGACTGRMASLIWIK